MKKLLEQIGNINETSQQILKYLHTRKRFRNTSNIVTYKVKLIQAGYKINPDDYRNFWSELQKQGFGTLKEKIFTWSYNFRNLEERKVSIPKKEPVQPAAQRLIFIPTMSGHEFEITLPARLSESDIQNISRVLRKIQRRELP